MPWEWMDESDFPSRVVASNNRLPDESVSFLTDLSSAECGWWSASILSPGNCISPWGPVLPSRW